MQCMIIWVFHFHASSVLDSVIIHVSLLAFKLILYHKAYKFIIAEITKLRVCLSVECSSLLACFCDSITLELFTFYPGGR